VQHQRLSAGDAAHCASHTQDSYTGYSAPPAVQTHAARLRARAVLSRGLALRGEMGRVPVARPRPRRRLNAACRATETHSFPALNEAMRRELGARSGVLDGEIVCLDRHGKPQFRDLLFRRGEPR
jgi:hypothetical protein